jgi:S1-C subfamily serine protease
MSSMPEWRVPTRRQPKPDDYSYDLEDALAAMAVLRSTVPADAFSAETLGTERQGNAVHIGGGQALTIGYLINEAETIWLSFSDGRVVQATTLGYDSETGFGLVQALGEVRAPALSFGDSDLVRIGDPVVVGGAGGPKCSIAAEITGRQEFAGYWEYLVEDALFTAPAHPNWGGTALIGRGGDLIGVGSLQLERARQGGGDPEPINMFVPINLLKPVLKDLRMHGRPNRAGRPWIGVHAAEIDGNLVVIGLARRGPARTAGLQRGDLLAGIAGEPPQDLADFYRRLWSLGSAGVDVPLLIVREGRRLDVRIPSADRAKQTKAPRLH